MADLLAGATALRRNTATIFFRLRQSSTYDLLMRLPFFIWSAALAFISAAALPQFMQAADPALPVLAYCVGIAMRLSVIAYLVILAATVILRNVPTARARGIEPRFSALTGTFLITGIVLLPRHELSLSLSIVSALLTLAG